MIARQLSITPADYAAAAAAAMTEEQLYESVRAICEALRLLHYHTRDSRGSTAGYPDLHIVGPAGQIFRELKTQRGQLRPQQLIWLDALHDLGANASVWRPLDL